MGVPAAGGPYDFGARGARGMRAAEGTQWNQVPRRLCFGGTRHAARVFKAVLVALHAKLAARSMPFARLRHALSLPCGGYAVANSPAASAACTSATTAPPRCTALLAQAPRL